MEEYEANVKRIKRREYPLLSELQKEGLQSENLRKVYGNLCKLILSQKYISVAEKDFILDYQITSEAQLKEENKSKNLGAPSTSKEESPGKNLTAAKTSQTKVSTSVEDEEETYEDTSEVRPSVDPSAKMAEVVSRAGGSGATIKLNELVIKPTVFDGIKPQPRKWIEEYDDAIEANTWTNEIAVKYFPHFLIGNAKDWYKTELKPSMIAGTISTYAKLKEAFVKNYIGDMERSRLNRLIEVFHQRPQDTISIFIPKLRRLLLQRQPDMSEKEQVQTIIDKLRQEFKQPIVLKNPTSVNELRDLAMQVESTLPAKANNNRQSYQKGTPRRQYSGRNTWVGSNNKGNYNSQNRYQTNSVTVGRRNNTNNNRYTQGRQNRSQQSNRPSNGGRKCFRCDRNNHVIADCRAKFKLDGSPIKRENNTKKWNTKPQSQVNTVSDKLVIEPKPVIVNKVNTIQNMDGKSDYNLIKYTVKCNGMEIEAIIDTGAVATVIQGEIVRRYKWDIDRSCKPYLIGANGDQLDTIGVLELNICMKIGKESRTTLHKMVVVNNLNSAMLVGLELLRHMGVCIDTKEKKLMFKKENRSGIRLIEETIVPPRAQIAAQAKVQYVGTILTKPFTFNSNIIIANAIAESKDNNVPVLVANISNIPITLPANTQVATFEEFDKKGKSVNLAIQLPNSEEVVNIGDELSPEQRAELSSILIANADAFSLRGEIGISQLTKHKIELTPDAKPVVEPLRRRAQIQIDETRRQVGKLLEEDIIEESDSPWASAYVLAKKKSGEMRLCIDFRKLNNMTKKLVYPLPNIENCLDTLAGKRYFSQIDFASGFWQILMDEKSREYTAFRTEDGLFQFKRMPFGLTNAPASFQRMINATLSGLTGINLQVFIDDVCVATDTWDEHMEVLDKLLKTVIRSKLKLKSSKCLFGTDKVVFLGHEISQQGIKQEPHKMKALLSLPEPKDAAEVRRVMGMFSYYRKFVPNFAMMAEPLVNLTRKNVDFVWDAKAKMAFNEIISALGNNATLAHFNHKDPIMVKTDASHKGVAGMLLQQQDGNWRIVTCCSRRLSQAEKNYGITELEGLAVIYTLTKLRPYLLGKRFQLLTDHCALCALKDKTSASARIRRWAIILSEFDMEIVYTKGDYHKDIDCLSRAPVDDAPDNYLDDKVYAITIPLNINEWEEDCQDDESKEIYDKAKKEIDNYNLKEGIIYHEDKLYVPKSKRESIMWEVHHKTVMHGGTHVTCAKLQDNYYWPKMEEDVRTLIRSCTICQKEKPSRQLEAGNMHAFKVYEPARGIAIDTMGPITQSKSGNSHVLVAIDMFTRFVEATAIKTLDANEFTKFLIAYCGRYGIPCSILTDNANMYCGHLTQDLMKSLHIEHKTSTPYHSRGNAVVERVLQTLQEKIRIAMRVNLQADDWDTVLPLAVLSINTSYHSSIGCTPFELTYGRKAPFRTEVAEQPARRPHDMYAEIVRNYLNDCIGDAQALQIASQERSRKYFEDKHRTQIFKEGDQVLIRDKSRRPKLNSPFFGPFKVVEKTNDIYKLRSTEGNKVLYRHTSALKPYLAVITLLQILLTTMLLKVNASVQPVPQHQIKSPLGLYEPAPPLLWDKTRYIVNTGIVKFNIVYKYISPCEILHGQTYPVAFRYRPKHENDHLFDSLHPSEVSSILLNPRHEKFNANKTATAFGVEIPSDPKAREIYQRIMNESLHTAMLSEKHANASDPDKRIGNTHREFYVLCNDVFRDKFLSEIGQLLAIKPKYEEEMLENLEWVSDKSKTDSNKRDIEELDALIDTISYDMPIQNTQYSVDQNTRVKRDIVGAIVNEIMKNAGSYAVDMVAVVSSNIVTNLITSVVDYYNPNSKTNRIASLEKEVAKLKKFEDFHKVATGMFMDQLMLIEETVATNTDRIRELEKMSSDTPRQIFLTTLLVNKITEMTEHIEEIARFYVMGLANTKHMAKLFGISSLANLNPRHTMLETIVKDNINTLTFNFTSLRVSEDTFVYRPISFRVWANLSTEHPVKFSYWAPGHLIYNETASCSKIIETPTDNVVYATCDRKQKVTVEKRTFNVSLEQEQIDIPYPQTYKTKHFSYIYCFPGYIYLDKAWRWCPSEVMKISVSIPWRTFPHTARHEVTHHDIQVSSKMNIHADLLTVSQSYEETEDTGKLANALLKARKDNRELKEKYEQINKQYDTIHESKYMHVPAPIGWQVTSMFLAAPYMLLVIVLCKLYAFKYIAGLYTDCCTGFLKQRTNLTQTRNAETGMSRMSLASIGDAWRRVTQRRPSQDTRTYNEPRADRTAEREPMFESIDLRTAERQKTKFYTQKYPAKSTPNFSCGTKCTNSSYL